MKQKHTQHPQRWLWDAKSTILQIAVFVIVGFVPCDGFFPTDKSKDVAMDLRKKNDPFSATGTPEVNVSVADSTKALGQSQLIRLGQRFRGSYQDISGHNANIELNLNLISGSAGRVYGGRGYFKEVNAHGHPRPNVDFTCSLTLNSDSTGMLEIDSFGGRVLSRKIATQFLVAGLSTFAQGTIWGVVRFQYEKSEVSGVFMLFDFGD